MRTALIGAQRARNRPHRLRTGARAIGNGRGADLPRHDRCDQGTVKVENDARLFATGIRVVGSIQLVQGERALLRDNQVGHDGGGNIVQGNKEDQCARL